MKTETSRRNILATGAAAPVLAAAVTGDDPIFAAIAEWQRLESFHIDCCNATDATEFGDEVAEYKKAHRAQVEALNAVCAHEDNLMEMQPTTKAGALAKLAFIGQWLAIASNEDEAADAIRNAVAVLEREVLS